MNIIQLQDALKDFSEDQLIREMQQPSGNAPQYLVLTEIERRQKLKQNMQSQQGNEPTVAEEAVSRKMPAQNSAIAESMARPSPAVQPPQMKAGGIAQLNMRSGGVVKASNGFFADVTNNPGNIRSGAGFIGETGSEKGYATFADPIYGMRALARLPTTYANEYGINTVEDFVGRYAPEAENKESFGNYVNFLSRQLGVRPDEEIDFTDPAVRQAMLPAIMDFEQGSGFSDRYDQSMFSAAVKAADIDDPQKVMTAFSQARSPEETRQPIDIPFIASAEASPSVTEQGARIVGKTRSGQPIYAGTDQGGITDIKGGRSQSVENFGEDPVILGSVEGESRKAKREAAQEQQREKQAADTAEAFRNEATAMAASPEAQQKRSERGPQAAGAPPSGESGETETDSQKRPAPDQTESTGMPTVNELLMELRDRQRAQVDAAKEDEEFNRYLAIAQMGAKLAEGKGPFVGAIGQAIGEGLPTLAAARQGVREAEKESLQTDIDIAQTLADAESKQAFGREDRLRVANAMMDDIILLQKQIDDMAQFGVATTPQAQARIDEIRNQIASLQRDRQLLIGGYGFGATPVTGQTPQTADQARASFKQAAGLE